MTTGRTLQPEDVLAHYRVVGPLGTGGMGEVYLAQDQTLERSVALKVLPAEFVRDDERLRRFVLEAKSASSLSHPNIVTIYEIGSDVVRSKGQPAEADSAPVQFISMELIQGRTLTTLIHEERTDLRTLLGYLAQAAEGLAKAHSAGIIHRDLKPGNIMVSGDGFAKVLDFGLAKLTERSLPDPDMSSAPTVVEQRTGAGAILGTTGYMSPEQVRGKPVDQRSDVFSFGCVLYEAVARARPFVAETAVETMHKILNEAPLPVEEKNPNTPLELRRIVKRCLAKNPDQRFQSMKDLALELREVVDEWDNLTLTLTSAGTTKNTMFPGTEAKRARWLIPAALIVAVVAVLVAGWSMFKAKAPAAKSSQPFQTMKISTQTNRGDVSEVAISRDGRYLAYLAGEVGQSSVRVRQVATGSDLEVVPSEDGLFEGLSFSPDGNYLFYLKRRRDAPNYRGLMQVASLGGESRERAFDVDSRASFSPDGKRVVYMRGEPQMKRQLLVVRDLESGKEHTLATINTPVTMSSAPDWSPDGKSIAVAELDGSKGLFLGSLVVFDADNGASKVLEALKGGITEDIAWLPDGSGVIRTGYDLGTAASRQIAIVDYPSGAVRRVTNDAHDYLRVSVSQGDEAIAALRQTRVSDLVSLDVATRGVTALTSYGNSENSPFNVSMCSDGTILFSANRNQSLRIWSIGAGGGAPKPLTDAKALSINPKCFDGGFVFDRFDIDGGGHVWRADRDGSNTKILTPGSASQSAGVARNGTVLTYFHVGGGVWMVPLSGGEPKMLGDGSGGMGIVSRDGTKVLNAALSTGANGLIKRDLKIVAVADASETNGPDVNPRSENFDWTPDGTALSFVDKSTPVWNLWLAPLHGAPKQITSFPSGRITDYEFSPDGRKIAVALTIGKATNIWVCGADGAKPEQLTNFAGDDIFDVKWMPDGSKIVVNAGRLSRDAVLIRDFR
jgi:serine/threonine protein kinase/Tol biopolymer transport system component